MNRPLAIPVSLSAKAKATTLAHNRSDVYIRDGANGICIEPLTPRWHGAGILRRGWLRCIVICI